MLAAVIHKTSPWYQNLSINWFDLALIGLLAFGFWRGRKRGMTKEFLPMLQWVTTLLGAGFGHIPLAAWFEQMGVIRQVFGNHFHEHTAALVCAYISIMMVIFLIFAIVKQKFNPKLEGSNFFGSNEYYWGVVAGLVRFACMILVALALLNAPLYTAADVAAIKQYKLNTFAAGGHIKGMENDTGNFIPSIYEIQDSVFKNSLIGPVIKQKLSILLINSTAATGKHS